MLVRIFTDGACSENPGPGGWCAVFYTSTGQEVISGHEVETTNNRMELMAFVEALEKIKKEHIDGNVYELYSDSAYVVNANEINIGGNSIFLYGIYVNPRSREGTLGKQYLEKLIGNDTVHCVASAYTRQGVATAICFVGNVSINHSMVNSGYSQNVSLKPL